MAKFAGVRKERGNGSHFNNGARRSLKMLRVTRKRHARAAWKGRSWSIVYQFSGNMRKSLTFKVAQRARGDRLSLTSEWRFQRSASFGTRDVANLQPWSFPSLATKIAITFTSR